jgi:hypothetical protein
MDAEPTGLTVVLLLAGFIGFWWGVFRKRGHKARWIIPSLIMLMAAPYFSPAWQAQLREENARPEAASVGTPPKPTPPPAPAQPAAPIVRDADVIVACRNLMRDNLRAPSTAKFPGWLDDPGKVWKYQGTYRVRSWVDAQNAFGAMVRTDYLCEFNPTNNVVTILEARTR